MSFDPTSPASLVILVPDEVRLAGRPESTPDEVLRAIVVHLYAEEDTTIVPLDDPGMRKAVEKSMLEVAMIGGGLPEEISPFVLRFTIQDEIVTRHVRGVQVKLGAKPKGFIDYRNLARYGLEEVPRTPASDVIARLREAEAKLAKWQTRAGEHADERDEAQKSFERAEERAEAAETEAKKLARAIEDLASEAIVIVPEGRETVTESMRRRIRQLEQLLERARAELVHGDVVRTVVKIELANKAMRAGLQVILAAAAPSTVLSSIARIRFVADTARKALEDAAKRWATPEGEEAPRGISEWASDAATFCAILASKTGAPHEDECDCQGCVAHQILMEADAMGITWKDPNEELLEESRESK